MEKASPRHVTNTDNKVTGTNVQNSHTQIVSPRGGGKTNNCMGWGWSHRWHVGGDRGGGEWWPRKKGITTWVGPGKLTSSSKETGTKALLAWKTVLSSNSRWDQKETNIKGAKPKS